MNFTTAYKQWKKFWFEAPHDKYVPGFRVIFGSLLSFFYFVRGFDLKLLYSEAGLLPLSSFEAVMHIKARYSLLANVTDVWVLYVAHFVLIGSLILMTVGYFPKVFAIVAYILQISFLHRNIAVAFGVDFISVFFLFYLCFMLPWKSGSQSKGSRQSEWSQKFQSVGFRLAQIQVCVIYFYSGVDKLKGQLWWKGEALWQVLANPELARFDFWWTAQFSFFLILLSYLTLLWEIYFGVLVWNSKLRNAVLLGGVAMHLMIGLTIQIPFFAAIMVSTYLLFTESNEVKAFLLRFDSIRRLRKIKLQFKS